MASNLRVAVPDANELARDLESAALGTGRVVNEIRKQAAAIVARRARLLTPVGPGAITGAQHPDDHLGHIRDSLAPRAAGVITTHPGGVVHEHGGTIAPNGGAIAIKASHMAERGGRQKRRDVERLMQTRFDELLASI